MNAVSYCWIILCGNTVLLSFSLSTQEDTCRSIKYNGHEEGKALTDHIIAKHLVSTESMCKVHCYLDYDCVSFNFGRNDTGKDHICELNNSTNRTYLKKRQYFAYHQTLDACRSSPCQNYGKCQYGFTAKTFRCLCPEDFHGELCETQLTCGTEFDFENGLSGWNLTGTVFNNQPTYGDNPTARNSGQPSNHQGDWWIGGWENRPSSSSPAGGGQGDGPQGSLTSPTFVIAGNFFTFLIGGGCNIQGVRAELIVEGNVVRRETGSCHESMTKKRWNVSGYIGKQAQLRLIDNVSGGWGHLNFDHFKEICG